MCCTFAIIILLYITESNAVIVNIEHQQTHNIRRIYIYIVVCVQRYMYMHSKGGI